MNSLSLLFWIVSGILLQLSIYLGIAYWRHWRDYHALPNQEDLDLTVGGSKSRDVVSGDERTRKTGGHRRRNKIEYSGQ